MKNKIFNKRNIIVSSLVLLVILVFAAIYYVDLAKFNSNLTKMDNKYVIKVSHLIGDKEELDENSTINDTVNNHENSVLYFGNSYVTLTKKGDYLYANLGKFTNPVLLEEVTDVIYSKNNTNGELIDGCSYDKKTKTLKIPYSYYDDSEKIVPIQVEIESLLTKEQINNVKTNFSVKKLVTHDDVASNELISLDTKISLSKYINKKTTKKNIFVYVNGFDNPISENSYLYDDKTNILTINLPSLFINRVDIRIGNNIFNNAFAYSQVAVEDMNAWKLSSEPNGFYQGYSYVTDEVEPQDYDRFIYCDNRYSSDWCNTGADPDWSYYKDNYWTHDWITESGYIGPIDSIWYDDGYLAPFSANLEFIGSDKLSFVDYGDWIVLACADHGSYAGLGPIRLLVYVEEYNASEKWMILRISTDGGPDRDSLNTQKGIAFIKVYWEERTPQTCSITPLKAITSTNSDSIYGFSLIQLYSNASCTGSTVGRTVISIYGGQGRSEIAIGGLTEDTSYYMKEEEFNIADLSQLPSNIEFDSCDKCSFVDEPAMITNKCFYDPSNVSQTTGKPKCLETRLTNVNSYLFPGGEEPKLVVGNHTLDLTNVLGTSFNPNTTCKPVTCSTGVTGRTITNIEESKFCYKIKKTDSDSGAVVTGTKWRLENKTNPNEYYEVTATDGTATFTNLKNEDYRIKEIQTVDDYWNDHSNWEDVNKSSLTRMNGDSCNISNPVVKTDTKEHYCLKVRKVDYSTGETINGAEFEAKNPSLTINKNSGANYYNSSNGVVSFFIENPANAGDFNVTETKAPDGYEKDNTTHTLQALLLSKEYTTVAAARQACFGNGNTADGSTMNAKTIDSNNGNNNFVFKDKKYLINWYKTTENGTTKVDGAEFRVKASNGKFITVSNAPESITDASGATRACYKYTGEANTGTVMISGDKGSTNVTMTGEVCVSGLPTGTYQVIEIKAPEYHTFGTGSTKSITTSTSFANMSDMNKLVNYPTEFRFTKNVVDTDGSQVNDIQVNVNGVNKSLSEITTSELMKIGFTIYDSNGNTVALKEVSSGNYEYGSNTIDQGGSGNNVTVLHLSSNREIYVKHLPKGTYTIKEVDTSSCGWDNGGFNTVDNPTTRPPSAPSCSGGGTSTGDCIGYYSPDYSTNTYSFTIDDCSSSSAAQNTGSCSSGGIEVQSLTNIPTEITFTKKDLYSYQDQADIVDSNRDKNSTESSVEFENAKERSDFDRIDFKVKDSNGNYLNFIYVGGTSTTCTSDSDYSIYRYVPGLTLPSGVDPNVFNYHTNGNGLTITQTLHACGGHIKLIGLCRGETYTFEEIRVPDDSVYVLEKVGALNPEVCFEVPCSTDESEHRTSTTAVINDKPTRVIFEKRDGKYNYLIPDETTTFEVYRCPKGTSCSPSSYSTVAERESAGMKLIKFEKRAVIANDEEDTGIEVYKMMSDSDLVNKQECTSPNATNCYIKDIHPYNGKLVLRYLQSGYNYVLLETVAPKGYMLPSGKSAETEFTVINTTVDVEEINIPNKPTALLIRKYADIEGDGVADSGKLLGGAKFKVYKVINYNANKKIQDQEKELLQLKTIKEGIYENRPVLDTDVITTCSGESCSYDPDKLGYENTDLENIDDLIEKSGSNITSVLKEGTALVQYLDYDAYYIIEEVEAPVGYSLPEKDDNRFTLVHINRNESAIVDTGDALVNKPSSFTFYKFDEYNTPLDGATFYLQKLDNEKNYNTLNVVKETLENGDLIYKADTNSELQEITTVGGKATVYYLEPGQYRIIEVAAPAGYELPKKTINVATFFVDQDGLVYGNNIITNKKPGETFEYLSSAKSELIINIQTGKVVIKYGLIITVLIAAIAGLIIFLRKRK